ncbi:Exosome complex exonuclease rrp44, partial [Globisporangium splendens]
MAHTHDEDAAATGAGESALLWCVDERNFATKRGKIIRTVKERYLRDDLSCSIPNCSLCVTENDTTASSHVMGMTKSILSTRPHNDVYLVPSMEVVLHQMDVLEFSTRKKHMDIEVFADIIILETVWEFVKRHDLGVYNRLRALIMNPDRRFVVFANEHHRVSYVQKKRKLPVEPTAGSSGTDGETSGEDNQLESDEERNRRAVAVAWKWYANHLLELQRRDVKVLFVANNAEDLANAELHGVKNGTTIEEFLRPIEKECPELRDLMSTTATEGAVASSEGVSSSKKRKTLYPEHLKMSEILAGIKNKRFFQGVIRCNRDHALECHVLIHGVGDVKVPVLIQGREHINRAIDGDVVAIQLLPKSQWKKPSDSFAASGSAAAEALEEDDDLEREKEEDERPEDIGVAEPTVPLEQAALIQSDLTLSIKPAGKVVGIIQRNWRKFCGSLEPPRTAGAVQSSSGHCLFVPIDRKVPKIKIQTRQQDTLMDKRILVAIDSWPADSKFPIGHYVRTLGVIGDKETETNVLLIEHDIPTDQFSDEVMRCLPPEDWKITEENSIGRRDLRGLPVMSIDPPNCKDIDDALHVSLLPNGNLQVGVHIADVTHFVAPGSPLDEEAADRGTSTYLVDRRLDMLPGLLTTKLCSLTSTEDHFAFSVLWEMQLVGDREVQIIDVSFCKSIIRSVASLSYQEAQVFLDDPEAGAVLGQEDKKQGSANGKKANKGDKEHARKNLLGGGIKTLNAIATRLRAKRIQAGALTLASPEVRFVLDTETQNPLDVQMYALRDTNALVEEFMLLANITVAKKIVRHFPTFSMLRRHPAPSKRQFDLLCSQAKAVGVDLQVDSSKQLQDSLDAAQEQETKTRKKNPYFNKLLRILCTRCMMPASYFSSGEVTPKEFHHYGLAAPIYTHFTSPIRRYADVVVHRLLAAAIGVTPLPSYLENKSHLHEISEQLNRRHHAAQLAGRASTSLHTLLYFKQFPTTTDAVITKVKNNGVGVLLPRFGIEGMIFLCEKDEQDDKVVSFDADKHILTLWKQNGRQLQVFDKVQVKVYVVLTFGNRQELKMDLVTEEETSAEDNDTSKKRPQEQQQKSLAQKKRKS